MKGLMMPRVRDFRMVSTVVDHKVRTIRAASLDIVVRDDWAEIVFDGQGSGAGRMITDPKQVELVQWMSSCLATSPVIAGSS
jgi:hypothetical protein